MQNKPLAFLFSRFPCSVSSVVGSPPTALLRSFASALLRRSRPLHCVLPILLASSLPGFAAITFDGTTQNWTGNSSSSWGGQNFSTDFSGWTPAALGSSLALWLDAADSSTITLNGSTVSQWNDKSGNGRHVSQTTAARQPTYSATGMLGNPTLGWGANINNISLSRTGMTAGYSPIRYFGVADHDGANPFSEYAGLVSPN